MGESWSELFKGWGWGLPKAHCPVHGEAVDVSYGPADWQRKGGVSFGGTLLPCSNPRAVSLGTRSGKKVANWVHRKGGLA